MTNVTITTIRADRRYSGVKSSWKVQVRGVMADHRSQYIWRHRGEHASSAAANQAAESAAREAGAIQVQIEEVNAPNGMPIIMDAARDYGVPTGWVAQQERVIAVEQVA